MALKWMGAVLVITGCGGWGCLLASGYRRQERLLRKLSVLLRSLCWELRYRLTSLPDLCTLAARDCSGELRTVFLELGKGLEEYREPDAYGCMQAVLQSHGDLPPKVKRLLRHLGRTLGRYDLEGQLEGMECVIRECEQEQQSLKKDLQIRLSSCRTLTLCMGVALVILFI